MGATTIIKENGHPSPQPPKFCPECGKPLDENAEICPSCGVHLNALPPRHAERNLVPKTNIDKGVWKAMAMVLLAVLMVGVVLFIYMNTPREPIPEFQSYITNDSTTISISHQGGDPLPRGQNPGQFSILVDGVDQTSSFVGPDPFTVGTNLIYNSSVIPKTVVLVYHPHSGGAGIVLSVADLQHVTPSETTKTPVTLAQTTPIPVTVVHPTGGKRRDIDLTRLDPDGNILWNTRIYGEGEDDLNLKDILVLPDGGSALWVSYFYIKPGTCFYTDVGNAPCYYTVPRLIRLDGNGRFLWDQVYENLGNVDVSQGNYYSFESVGRTLDGGFTAYGFDSVLHFLDGEGNEEKCLKIDDLYNTDPEHGIGSMVPGPGGTIFAVGGMQYYFHPVLLMPGWLAVFDRNYTMAWEMENRSAEFVKGIPTSDGGYLVEGEFLSQAFVQRLDAEGNIRWSTNLSCKSYIGSDVREKEGFQILCYTPHLLYLIDKDGRINGELDPVNVSKTKQGSYDTRLGFTSDGNFWRMDPVSGNGVRISKFSTDGRVLWEKDLPAGEGITAVPEMIKETSDGGLLVARYAGRDSFQTGSPNRSPWTVARILPEEICTPTPLTTLISEERLVLNDTPMRYPYYVRDSPLIIEYNLRVPNIRETRFWTDPKTGRVMNDSILHPDPASYFNLEVKDLDTDSAIIKEKEGFADPYNNIYTKRVWIRYPGNYSIEFSGNRVTADVAFLKILASPSLSPSGEMVSPGNLILKDEKVLVLTNNTESFTYDLRNTPLHVECTLTAPNTAVADKYLPDARFEITVKNQTTDRIVAQYGLFGAPNNVQFQIKDQGIYTITITGNLAIADVKFYQGENEQGTNYTTFPG